jgi:hypothetical protein
VIERDAILRTLASQDDAELVGPLDSLPTGSTRTYLAGFRSRTAARRLGGVRHLTHSCRRSGSDR